MLIVFEAGMDRTFESRRMRYSLWDDGHTAFFKPCVVHLASAVGELQSSVPNCTQAAHSPCLSSNDEDAQPPSTGIARHRDHSSDAFLNVARCRLIVERRRRGLPFSENLETEDEAWAKLLLDAGTETDPDDLSDATSELVQALGAGCPSG